MLEIEPRPDNTIAIKVDGHAQILSPNELSTFVRDLLAAAMNARLSAKIELPPIVPGEGSGVPVLTPSRVAHQSLDPQGRNQNILMIQCGSAVIGFDIPVLLKMAQAIVASSAR